MATDGAFVNGIGARNKALAGAGVADQTDATAIAVNPAAIAKMDNHFTYSISAFVPTPEFTNAAFFGGVSDESQANFFLLPSSNWVRRIDADSSFGIGSNALFGQGTDYRLPRDMGIELSMGVISFAYARRFGALSVGVAPELAVELFKAKGFLLPGRRAFRDSTDIAFGIGVSAGAELEMTHGVRLGVAGNSPYYMQDLDKYRGLLGPDGNARVPATITAGVAVDVSADLTLMADYKFIANSTSPTFSGNPLRGQGFGWDNQNIFKVAAELRYSPDITLRGGYSYNTSAIGSFAADFNVLAPAVSQHHITGGGKYRWSEAMDIEFAGMYSPQSSVRGNFGTELSMDQYELTVGIVRRLGGRSYK